MSLGPSQPVAVIFDMDGVLVDSNPFHLRKWAALFRAHGIPFDEKELPQAVLGPANQDILRRFLGPHLTKAELEKLGEELEANFRREIGPHPQPLAGVRRFLHECYAQGIPMAVASAAIAKNVKFLLDSLHLRRYFRVTLAADGTVHPKPHPEIYLKTATLLTVVPTACVVFEDSFVGIEAAKRAGMKCVAIASTFSADELRTRTGADLVVQDFQAVTLPALGELF